MTKRPSTTAAPKGPTTTDYDEVVRANKVLNDEADRNYRESRILGWTVAVLAIAVTIGTIVSIIWIGNVTQERNDLQWENVGLTMELRNVSRELDMFQKDAAYAAVKDQKEKYDRQVRSLDACAVQVAESMKDVTVDAFGNTLDASEVTRTMCEHEMAKIGWGPFVDRYDPKG